MNLILLIFFTIITGNMSSCNQKTTLKPSEKNYSFDEKCNCFTNNITLGEVSMNVLITINGKEEYNGKIMDELGEEPLSGANIYAVEEKKGKLIIQKTLAKSDSDGKFSISKLNNETGTSGIVIYYVSYKALYFPIK